jgi:cobalt/nickel transport system permease protein
MRHAFLDKYAGLESPIHQLDARAKIVAFFALIVISVTTPPDAWAAFLGYGAFLALIACASCVPPGYLLRRAWVILPFLAAAALSIPFLKPGGVAGGYNFGIRSLSVPRSGWMVFWNVFIKSGVAILSMILLSSTTPFPRLLRGLEQLKVPRVLVMLASFAYRYLFVLVDEAERMERARDSRCYGGRWLWQARVIGGMIGALFLRSYERAERVYVAMVSRGFDGRAALPGGRRMTAVDGAFVVAAVGWFLALRLSS